MFQVYYIFPDMLHLMMLSLQLQPNLPLLLSPTPYLEIQIHFRLIWQSAKPLAIPNIYPNQATSSAHAHSTDSEACPLAVHCPFNNEADESTTCPLYTQQVLKLKSLLQPRKERIFIKWHNAYLLQWKKNQNYP